MAFQKRILIVDDSEELRDALSAYLTKSGFDVVTAVDGEQMHKVLDQGEPSLIILDVMLPGDDGFTLCSQIRKTSNVPIIMLTAVTDEIDRVTGLELGADDYITKTFSPRELLARIKALLRRSQFNQGLEGARYICFLDWKLDTLARVLVTPSGDETTLSGADFSLLSLFLRHPNKPLSRNIISETIRGREAMPLERGIDIQVSRLRAKLEDQDHSLIRTLRNEGYMLSADVIHEA
ncbi:response regulator transcription factor [Grimontia sp. SpTr1]|uniref:response regulator n=1 Tax=Grimontia sp. SpTr1 TaxID=2995319 RepID=UPI00248CBAE6|nr:response regulator transcription factor [Grimontia sp. SpTr1]